MDAIIHLSTAKPSQKQWEETFDVSFRGTYNVFEAARQNNVPRVVYASRAGVVDAYPYNVKRTTHLYPIPGSFYTLSKIFAEGLARIYSDKHGIETVGIRIGNIKPHRPVPTVLIIVLEVFDWVCHVFYNCHITCLCRFQYYILVY